MDHPSILEARGRGGRVPVRKWVVSGGPNFRGQKGQLVSVKPQTLETCESRALV